MDAVPTPEVIVGYRDNQPLVLFKFRAMKDGTIMIIPSRLKHLRAPESLEAACDEFLQCKFSIHPSRSDGAGLSTIVTENVNSGAEGNIRLYQRTQALKLSGKYAPVAAYRVSGFSGEEAERRLARDTRRAALIIPSDMQMNTIFLFLAVSAVGTFPTLRTRQNFDCYTAEFDYFNLHLLVSYLYLPAYPNQWSTFFYHRSRVGGQDRVIENLDEQELARREKGMVEAEMIAQANMVSAQHIIEVQGVLERALDLPAGTLDLSDLAPFSFPLHHVQLAWEVAYQTPIGQAFQNIGEIIEMRSS